MKPRAFTLLEVMLTVSATPDMRMLAASVTACPTVKPMFSWTNVAKPGSV